MVEVPLKQTGEFDDLVAIDLLQMPVGGVGKRWEWSQVALFDPMAKPTQWAERQYSQQVSLQAVRGRERLQYANTGNA